MQPWQRMSKPEEPVYRRKSATHHMETGKDNADGTPGKFVESAWFAGAHHPPGDLAGAGDGPPGGTGTDRTTCRPPR